MSEIDLHPFLSAACQNPMNSQYPDVLRFRQFKRPQRGCVLGPPVDVLPLRDALNWEAPQDAQTLGAHRATKDSCTNSNFQGMKHNGAEVLMEATKYCSLGQLTVAMFEVGGSFGGICR